MRTCWHCNVEFGSFRPGCQICIFFFHTPLCHWTIFIFVFCKVLSCFRGGKVLSEGLINRNNNNNPLLIFLSRSLRGYSLSFRIGGRYNVFPNTPPFSSHQKSIFLSPFSKTSLSALVFSPPPVVRLTSLVIAAAAAFLGLLFSE